MSNFLGRLAGAAMGSRNFRLIWAGCLLAYLATWMGTVGTAWLMAQIDSRPLMVALIQTANTLPYFLLSLPAGVLADLVDRRKVMLWMQAGNVLIALVLSALLWRGAIHPYVLLLLSFLFGAMLAINAPAMQSAVSDVVPRSQLAQAVALNSMSYNMARSLGPALAGLLLTVIAPVWLFLVVAVGYATAWLALYQLPQAPLEPQQNHVPPESLWIALRTGLRFARHAPAVHAVLFRSVATALCGSALWALLPLLASRLEGGGPAGYGLLVTCLGGGAIAGGLLMPWLRERLNLEQMVTGCSLLFACCSALAALLHQPWQMYLDLLLGGAAWLVACSELFAVAQTSVPVWVRARSTSIVLVAFQGGMAAGAVMWGMVASGLGVQVALVAAAVLSVPLHWFNRRYPLQGGDEHALRPAPQGQVKFPDPSTRGTLLEVEVRYRVRRGHRLDFIRQAEALGASRRRNGAGSWQLLESMALPEHFVERFSVSDAQAWQRHLERTTMGDLALFDALQAFVEPLVPPQTEYFTAVPPS